jgi:hypothetical protein
VVENVRITTPLRAEPIFNELGFFNLRWSEYFEETAETINVKQHDDDVFQSLNPSASAISALNKRIRDLELLAGVNAASSAVSALSKRVDDLVLLVGLMPNLSGFARQLTVVSVSADYTSVGNEIIICTNTTAITITLSSTANDLNEIKIVRQGAGLVTVSGPVNGSTGFPLVSRYDAPDMIFTVEAGEYSII